MKFSIFLLLTTLAGILMGAAGQDSGASPDTTTAGNDEPHPTTENSQAAETTTEKGQAEETTTEGTTGPPTTAGSTKSKDFIGKIKENLKDFTDKVNKYMSFLG